MTHVKRSEDRDDLEQTSTEQARQSDAHKTGVARGGDVNPEARHSRLSIRHQSQDTQQSGVNEVVENSEPDGANPSGSAAEQEPVGPTRR